MPAGRPKLTHCYKGHDITVVGRYGNGKCRACHLKNDNPPPYWPGRRGRRKVENSCINGHPAARENRYWHRGKDKGCLICIRQRSEAYRRAQGAKPIQQRPVPYGPIGRYVDSVGVKEFARTVSGALGIQSASVERLLFRGREAGFTIDAADDICVAIGRHPAEVFGPEWFTYGAKEVASAV